MTDNSTSELGKAVQEVSEKASLLVREEIALAKAELTEKITGLAKGAAVGAAAGVFILAGLIYFLHFLALLIADLLGDTWWLGYLIVAGVLFLAGGVAGFLAARFFKKGSPPTPTMAIEEAQLIKATLTAPHPSRPEGPTGAVQAPETANVQARR
jgi:putative superfamily III holin-X